MKTILILLLLCAPALGQAVKTHHHIGRVEGDGPSRVYVARTPYTLRWTVDAKYKLYGNHNPAVKAESYIAGVHVRDVDTGKLVHTLGQVPYHGETKVLVAGRHTVQFFSTAPWEASFVEDRAMLEAAARNGKLRDNQVLGKEAVDPRAGIEKMKAALKSEIAKTKADAELKALHLMAVDKAAHLASDEQDLVRRYKALAPAANEIYVQGVTPQPPAHEPSKWDGRGLPPGMGRK